MNILKEDLKSQLKNEENTKHRLITPVIQERWGPNLENIIMEYYFTDGQVNIDDDNTSRGEPKKADYMLLHKNNVPLALVEAKGEEHAAMEGYQQVIDYATILDIPFAYSTNGHELIEQDMILGKNKSGMTMNDFPYPDELWDRYVKEKGFKLEEINLINQPYFVDTSGINPKKPRYYQRIAINRTIEGVAQGKNRLLLVMATGTGKTFTAFQIVWRLWKSRTKRKILYLVDRNILADQTMSKDFKPFVESGIMVKIKSNRIKKDTAYEIYTALYQQLKSSEKDYYKELPSDFFDFIIVDECHRGSAREDSEWHEILEYFSSATQLGLTATPKETEDTSNIDYFGEPIYVYSLKQGIEDGFLAPYKVISCELDIDREGYRPQIGELDVFGKPLENKLYKAKDFDRTIVVESRRDAVAEKIAQYIEVNRCEYSKMIIFCENIKHVDAMVLRLKNLLSKYVMENPKYIMKITGDDKIGKDELENFIDPNTKYPVIAVTSQLMSTGVDSETCETIVLDKAIGSMTEFKQIIGRGTRINENFEIDNEKKSKLYFTILDFRGNYHQFEDPDFDGKPAMVMNLGEHDKFTKPKEKKKTSSKSKKTTELYVVKGKKVTIENEETSYLDENGNLIKQNIKSCIKNNILDHYATYDEFYVAFKKSGNKREFLKDLLISDKYVNKLINQLGYNIDKFDIATFIGYKVPPKSKEERLSIIFDSDLYKNLDFEVQKVIKIILNDYKIQDFELLKDTSAYKSKALADAGYTPITIHKNIFGGNKKTYIDLMKQFEELLY
ncbi:DEAD/DEAH box helicase family protein [Clostridium perfringens]|nr:DEAD/DEAH box helicase family protein [Clostridium perfringens]